MTWDKCVIDASMGARDGVLCFCPVETDEDGEIVEIVTGMNFLFDPPDHMQCIAIVHPDGQDAVEAFCAEHKDALDEFAARQKARAA